MTTKFTQKYAIIQLFEHITEGTEWDWQTWPLHSTIADVFAVDWDETTLLIELAELPNICTSATSTVVGETYFGPDKQTHVMLLDKTPDLTKLHLDVVGLLKKVVGSQTIQSLQRMVSYPTRPYKVMHD